MAYLTQFSSSVPVIKYPIDQLVMTIGQDIEMDICVPEDGLAENHAAVEVIQDNESYRFVIKTSENMPLFELNGETAEEAELKDGDWLIIGGVEFQFTDDGVNSFVETNEVSIPAVDDKPQLVQNMTNKADISGSEALQLIRELKEDLEDKSKPLSTKEFIANSRQSRRRLAF